MQDDGEAGATGRVAAAIRRRESTITLGSALLIVLSLPVIARRLPIARAAGHLEGWIDGLGPWGPAIFGAIYAAAVVLMAPASVLTLAAGATFGLVVGVITTSIASTIGAALAFLVARYLAREAVARRLRGSPRFAAIDRAIGRNGWKIVALLRLSPAVPFNVQNYLYGLTGIRFWPYALTSWIAMLPGTFLYVYLGHVGRAGLEAASGAGGRPRGSLEWAMIAVGLLATLAATIYIARLARIALREQAGIVEAGPLDGPPDAPTGWPWRATILAVLAISAVGAAVALALDPGSPRP